MRKSNLTWALLLLSNLLWAQPNLYTGEIAEKGNEGYGPKLIVYNAASAPKFDEKTITVNDLYGLNSDWSFRLVKRETDDLTNYVYRYQQYYRSIPVEWCLSLVHTTPALVFESITGEVLVTHEPAFTIPALTATDAVTKALESVNAKSYMWQNPSQEQWLKDFTRNPSATFYPSPNLCFMRVDDPSGRSFTYELCYKVDVYAEDPLSRADIYVHAVSGEIVNSNNKIHEGTANTVYNSVNPITTSSVGLNYQLKNTRTETKNMLQGFNYGAAVPFTDADDYWNNINPQRDEYATDAHWGTEKTLDYYMSQHGRSSIDGAGFFINSFVHYHVNYVNAFWDGLRMTYGDGDGSHTPLVSPDIVGHEITHGVTSHTANLAYQKESGALNEAFSDMFGTAVEFYCTSTPNWTMGEEIGTPFRDMSNPNAYSQPDTYNGLYYYTTGSCSPSGGNDQCGVHTNSGVANYWFYLLTMGGSGINDIGSTYSVTPIGITAAARIAYRTLTVYLTSASTFADARTYSLKAAADIYGNCSLEYIAVANAWYAVGVGAKYSAYLAPTGLFTNKINNCTATLNWTSNSSSGYEINYRKSGASVWTVVTTASTSYTLNTLLPGTTYIWKVRSVCGSVTSPFSSQVVFTTLATATTSAPVSTGGITTCSADFLWAANGASYLLFYKVSTASVWTSVNVFNNTYTLTGLLPNTTYNYKLSTNTGCQMTITTPVGSFTTLNGTAPTGIQAKRSACRFYVNCDYTAGFSYELEYRVLGATIWQSNPNFLVDYYRAYFITNVTALTTYEYRVNKIYAGGGGCTTKFPSAIFTTTTPAASGCTAPTGITLLSNGWIQTVTWNPAPSASSSNIRYKLSAGGAWIGPYPCDITWTFYGYNLNYLEVEVQSVCGCNGGGTSSWTNQVLSVPCGTITNTSSGLYCNFVAMAWNACSSTSGYNLRYRPVGSTVWTNATGLTLTVHTKLYSLLTPGTQYEWQVQNVCSDGTINPYTALQYFTTPPVCNPPTGITSINLAIYSITLTWNPIPPSAIYPYITSTGYVVRYRPMGTTVWLGNYNTTASTFVINGLTPSTNYEYQVQSICNAICGHYSAWSSTFVASTTCPTCLRIGDEPEVSTVVPENINVNVFPNPFSNNLTIEIALDKEQSVNIFISDLQGRVVANVLNKNIEEGLYRHVWQNNSILSGGTYLLSIKAGNRQLVKRIVNVK